MMDHDGSDGSVSIVRRPCGMRQRTAAKLCQESKNKTLSETAGVPNLSMSVQIYPYLFISIHIYPSLSISSRSTETKEDNIMNHADMIGVCARPHWSVFNSRGDVCGVDE